MMPPGSDGKKKTKETKHAGGVWIVDSGANDYLAHEKTDTISTPVEAAKPTTLKTENGKVELKKEVEVRLPGVKGSEKAILNPKSNMSLAPMGRMVEDKDHLVFWGKQEGSS